MRQRWFLHEGGRIVGADGLKRMGRGKRRVRVREKGYAKEEKVG